MTKNIIKKRNIKKQRIIERIVFETNPELNINDRDKERKNIQKQQNKKRQTNNLYKLYDKELIDQKQYASAERLLTDYESSFRNKCATTTLEEVKVQKTTKMNNEFHLIQNLNAWDRYNKAIASIEDLNTRNIVRQFVIEGKGFTEIDKELKKQGVAEVRLYYGIKELTAFYKSLGSKNR